MSLTSEDGDREQNSREQNSRNNIHEILDRKSSDPNIFRLKSYEKMLSTYTDKCYVYSILCGKSSRYFNMLKNIFSIPLILLASIMSVINGSVKDSESLKLLNICFNILTSLLIGINSSLRFESKANDFKGLSIKYQRLGHLIEQKLINEYEPISDEFILSIVSSYDNLTESINEDIPEHICINVRKLYARKRSLPNIINGVEKDIGPKASELKSDIIFK
jgi:hypothetical protein